MNTEVVRNPGKIEKLKKMFGVKKDVAEIKVSMTKENFLEESVKVGKKKLHKRKIAPVIIWDFVGQDVFYSTHQTFLTYRAIYLIVLDGSRNLDDPSPFEQYLPGKSGPKTARGKPNYKFHAIDQKNLFKDDTCLKESTTHVPSKLLLYRMIRKYMSFIAAQRTKI